MLTQRHEGINLPLLVVTLWILLTGCAGAVLTRNQCNSLPLICPQWCIGTKGGCTVCDCAKYGGIGNVNAITGLGAVLSGSGVSIINPAAMIGFGSGLTSGHSQLSGLPGQPNFNVPGGFNPANIGPSNPFTGGGHSDPSNPSGFGNPGNLGQAAGAGNPSNPGSSTSIGGNPVVSAGNPGNPGGNTQVQQTGQSGTGLGTGQAQPGQSGTGQAQPGQSGTGQAQPAGQSASTSITMTTTTSSPFTVSQSQITSGSATCAPLRCTPPCDKGIMIAANGCPVCLCKK